MKRAGAGWLAATTVLLAACGSPPADRLAADDPVRCTGTIGAREVPGTVIVPAGRTCRLEGTIVRGPVVVRRDATLAARSAVLAGGLHARGFEEVEITGGPVDGRPGDWRPAHAEQPAEYVLEDGGRVTVTDGNPNGDYRLLRNRGRVEVRGLFFDSGGLTCRGNRQRPVVRRISAETPGVLGGQCSGLRNGVPVPGVWGQTDF